MVGVGFPSIVGDVAEVGLWHVVVAAVALVAVVLVAVVLVLQHLLARLVVGAWPNRRVVRWPGAVVEAGVARQRPRTQVSLPVAGDRRSISNCHSCVTTVFIIKQKLCHEEERRRVFKISVCMFIQCEIPAHYLADRVPFWL